MRIKNTKTRAFSGSHNAAARLCTVATIGALAFGSVALATPANAAEADPKTAPVVTMLGGNERTTGGYDEWRSDFTVRVPKGQLPTKVEYNLYAYDQNNWIRLTEVDDVQAKGTGQHYGIVHTQDDGDYDILYISARGDLAVTGHNSDMTYQVGLRVTTLGGIATVRTPIEAVTRNSISGRPVAVQAYGTTTSSLPGYFGPNSRTGWSNVVSAESEEQLLGIKFHVDALSSSRSASNGCDVTDLIYYQFVRGDDGTPASITPEPKALNIKSHSGGIGGSLLTGEGKFSLDESGYYKLLVWPQASSSSATATQDCSLVSYNPAVLSEGTQVGSVFWKTPAVTDELVASITPLSVATPAAGDVVASVKPVFAGQGHPGATIEIKNDEDQVLASTIVAEDGTWSVELLDEIAEGDHSLTIVQAAGKVVSNASVDFNVTIPVELPEEPEEPQEPEVPENGFSVLAPALDEVVTTPNPVFSGKGEAGASVQVKGSSGRVLGAATVDENGDWSTTSNIALPDGGYVGTVVHDLDGVSTTAAFSYSIKIPVAAPELGFSLTSPAIDGVTTSSNPVFNGTGTPGALVEVRGNSGRVIASATVDENGTWSATTTIDLGLGRYIGTVSSEGSKTSFDYRLVPSLVMTSPTVSDPASVGAVTFTGTGHAGATIVLKGNSGRTVATATVDENGAWSAEAELDLPAGYYIGSAHHYLGDVLMDSITIDYSII